jgi:LysM repeat protein
MKTVPRVVLIAALLAVSIIAVLPASAGYSPSSATFQSPISPIDTPTPSSATNTPVPVATDTPIPAATDTPIPAATNTPIPAATNTPLPAATNTPLPAVTNTPIATQPPPVYSIIGYWTVQPGQTLYCIGRYYRVSPWAIAQTNRIPWPYYIYPGQVLAIPNAPWYNIPPGPVCYPSGTGVTPTPPAGATPTPPVGATPTPSAITPTPPRPPACRYYHYVRWGQTLSGIAWYYGTTIQAIMYANPIITNPNLIYAGSTLCIP